MSDDYWKLTCEILQNPSDPIVEKPKLQEKYLVKPPFRYCHDIISAVQKKTGFAPGLYEGAELDARAIQDKEAKVAYLQKIVDVVGLVLGQPVPVKPSKIVAGLEPENTNLFFQMLGRACKMDNGAQAVQQVLGRAQAGGEAPPAAPPARPASRPSSQQPDSAPPAVAPPPQDGAPEEPRKEKKREHRSSSREPSSKDKERPPSSSKHRSSKAPAPEPSPPPPSQPVVEVAPPAHSQPPARPFLSAQGTTQTVQGATPAPPAASVPPATPSAGGSRTGSAASGQHPRPSGMSEPAARPIAVMAEGAKDNSDDEVEVVHEQMPARRHPGPSHEQGVLVKDIREAEENLKKAGADALQAAGADDDSKGQGIILKRMGNKAGGHTGIKDFNVIREMVQKLCQASHPLAKSMDYLQEDLENMGKEYRFWQTERRVFADKLADEERLAGDAKGNANVGADLDNQIKQVRERTLGLKAQVLRNDETVARLLQMAVTGTGR